MEANETSNQQPATNHQLPIDLNSKIYIAGHTGFVGSAILSSLQTKGFKNFLLRTIDELNLIDQAATEAFFIKVMPDYVFMAVTLVGGKVANISYNALFLYVPTGKDALYQGYRIRQYICFMLSAS